MKRLTLLALCGVLMLTSCNRKTQTVPTMMEMFQHICGTMVDSNRHFVDIKDECLWLADSLLYYVENDIERSRRIGARVVAQEIVSSMLSDEPTILPEEKTFFEDSLLVPFSRTFFCWHLDFMADSTVYWLTHENVLLYNELKITKSDVFLGDTICYISIELPWDAIADPLIMFMDENFQKIDGLHFDASNEFIKILNKTDNQTMSILSDYALIKPMLDYDYMCIEYTSRDSTLTTSIVSQVIPLYDMHKKVQLIIEKYFR